MVNCKLLLNVLVMVGAASQIWAQQVSVEEARDRALSFISLDVDAGHRAPLRRTGSRSGNGADVTAPTDAEALRLAYTGTKEGKTCYYVFDVGQDEGFVIVGGDEVARTVLGSTDNGRFVYDELPCGLQALLGYYTDDIAEAIKAEEAAGSPRRTQRRMSASAVEGRVSQEKLLTTEWDQSAPYNRKCKNYGLEYTGCVMTAAAQVMNYFRYFNTGYGTASNPYIKVENEDFSEAHFDWQHMRDTYKQGEYTDEEADAVANLMYYLDVSFRGWNYYPGTASNEGNAYRGLINNFMYSGVMCLDDRLTYSDADWEQRLYHQIVEEEQPVLYYAGAHAFVLDGYRTSDNTFHVNWGWGGSADGYFALTDVNQRTDEAVKSSYFTDEHQTCIYSFYPATLMPDEPLGMQQISLTNGEQNFWEFDFTQLSSNVSLTFDAINKTEQTQSVRFSVALSDEDINNSVEMLLEPQSTTRVDIPINLAKLDQMTGYYSPKLLFGSPNSTNGTVFGYLPFKFITVNGKNQPYVNDNNICYYCEAQLSRMFDDWSAKMSDEIGYEEICSTDLCDYYSLAMWIEFNGEMKYLNLHYNELVDFWDDIYAERVMHLKYDPKIHLKLNQQGFGTMVTIFDQMHLPEGLQLYRCQGIDEQGVAQLVPADYTEPGKSYIVYGSPGEYFCPIDGESGGFGYTEELLEGKLKGFLEPSVYDDYLMLTEREGESVFVSYKTVNEDLAFGQAALVPIEGVTLPEVVHLPLPSYPGGKVDATCVGDTNADGRVDILDIVYLNHFLQGKTQRLCPRADADMNMLIDEDDVEAIETIVLGRVR